MRCATPASRRRWAISSTLTAPAADTTIYGSYFKGSLADAAFFEGKLLTLADETAIYNAGLHPQTLLTSATRASGKAYATVGYDPISSAVTSPSVPRLPAARPIAVQISRTKCTTEVLPLVPVTAITAFGCRP